MSRCVTYVINIDNISEWMRDLPKEILYEKYHFFSMKSFFGGWGGGGGGGEGGRECPVDMQMQMKIMYI